MVQIADKLSRSSKTVNDCIYFHNNCIKKATFCSRCKRANGIYAEAKAERQYLDRTS